MEEFLGLLEQSDLFHGIEEADIVSLLRCLAARKKSYVGEEYLYNATDYIHEIGFILSGKIHMIDEDFWGKKFILTEYRKGDVFGEAHSLTPEEPLLFDIVAVEKTKVLYFDIDRITTVSEKSSACHQLLLHNLLKIIARKKIHFLHKIEHMSRKSLREKVASYLSEQSKKQNSPVFDIPYNRQQMADFLSVDRSAMSGELSKMRDEGLITYKFNHFELKKADFFIR